MNLSAPEPTTNTAEPATFNLEPATNSPVPATSNESSEPSTCNLQPATTLAYRGTGKVARLPKPIRDQINHWLLDGVSYPDIIQRLGDQGQDLKPDNLSQWKKRGHQDWLLEQAWLEETRTRQEPASDLSADFDATQLNHAALQLGALQMFEVLRDLTSTRSADHLAQIPLTEVRSSSSSPSSSTPKRTILDMKLGGDSAAFVRLIDALVRASRETMLVQKYRDACARARAALRELDPKRKLDESETRAIVRKVDEILGLGSPTSAGRDEFHESPLLPGGSESPLPASNSSEAPPPQLPIPQSVPN